ncbi:hypothetical protein LZ318_11740 [Saccharopolyspora indica]|nr:hypothetical protein [Saccharopolyspora indica]MDA3643817.1 hypothetical protein [Saccharopolyspora indica]
MKEPFEIRSMVEAALALHEYYTSLIEAGFSEGQAFELTKMMITGGNAS